MKCIMDYNNIEQTNLLKGMDPYQEDTKLVDGISQEDFEESLPDNNTEGAGKSSSASSSESRKWSGLSRSYAASRKAIRY